MFGEYKTGAWHAPVSYQTRRIVIKIENAILRNSAFDLERARNILGEGKVDDAIAMAKQLEPIRANPKMKKKYWDRNVR